MDHKRIQVAVAVQVAQLHVPAKRIRTQPLPAIHEDAAARIYLGPERPHGGGQRTVAVNIAERAGGRAGHHQLTGIEGPGGGQVNDIAVHPINTKQLPTLHRVYGKRARVHCGGVNRLVIADAHGGILRNRVAVRLRKGHGIAGRPQVLCLGGGVHAAEQQR